MPWAEWGRHEAGHPYDVPQPTPSAVITREASVAENLSCGEETWLPQRLLSGLLPESLLERYTFWQDEADYLRGYPKDATKPDVIFVNMGVGGHVAMHGSRFGEVRRGDSLLLPARAVVLRLSKQRLQREHRAVHDALGVLEQFTKEHALLSQPFEPSFALCNGTAALLRRLGGHSFGAGSEPAVASGLEALRALLPRVGLLPFRRRRKRHRLPKIVVPALLDALAALLDADQSGAPDPPGGGGRKGEARQPSEVASASDFDEEELILLDLLHAPAESYLHSLATVLSRVESLSHVLAWAAYDDTAALGQPDAITQDELRIVSLPRLKLTFQALMVDNSVRLYSVDHADLFITNERSETESAMLEAIPHSLLLSNSNSECSVLVCAWPPCRPQIESVPFSTSLVLDRSDVKWAGNLEHPYYMYPVHVSRVILYTTTLASALYLLLLRFLGRAYKEVVRLVDTVGSDAALSREEDQILQFLSCEKNSPDSHPDASACRLKISLVLLDAPLQLPWDISLEMADYLFRLEHVSADCLLTPEEELTLLKRCICDVADKRCSTEASRTPLGVNSVKRRGSRRARVHRPATLRSASPSARTAAPRCVRAPRLGSGGTSRCPTSPPSKTEGASGRPAAPSSCPSAQRRGGPAGCTRGTRRCSRRRPRGWRGCWRSWSCGSSASGPTTSRG